MPPKKSGAALPRRQRGVWMEETLHGELQVQARKDVVTVNVEGWIIDKEKTRGPLCETFLFKHPFATNSTGNGLPQGWTHIARILKRSTGATSWKLVNKAPRTIRRQAGTKITRPRSSTKAKNTALVVAKVTIGCVTDL